MNSCKNSENYLPDLIKLECIMKEHDINDLDSLNNILTEYFQRNKRKKTTLQDVVQQIENRAENNVNTRHLPQQQLTSPLEPPVFIDNIDMNGYYQLESSDMECDVEEIPKEKPKPRKEYTKSNQDKEVKNIIERVDALEQQLQNMITEEKNRSENTLNKAKSIFKTYPSGLILRDSSFGTHLFLETYPSGLISFLETYPSGLISFLETYPSGLISFLETYPSGLISF
ncbi:hypothetical protein BY458DRAFT_543668 [Sporodiniella umbellata]|nr:hypothetical protein BY458DRAFT_543668 [Sporodiniella umbellata]